MKQRILLLSVAAGLLAVSAAVAQQGRGGRGVAPTGGECPPGTTLVRVGTCQAPEFPPPSIVDYRPKSSLVVDQHPVPRAKFPVVDIHSHTGPTPATIASLIAQMDALNIRVLNNLSGGSGDALAQRVRYINSTPHANRFTVFANGLNQFRGVAPGYGEQAAAQLEADVKNGAIGLKIFKETGMDTKKADGTRLAINDPELSPIWETAARLNIPVIIHTAEPRGILQAARHAQRAVARARLVRQPPKISRARVIRNADR